ncbi:protein FAM174C-like isoform X1 [Stegostoma tigrinum]|uniref:protein FAM174C-like isoform X1 n=1 Tax=Stegostoma tigrinum TaxID=3053191 RepID=UPI00202B9A94|nr:protein FAM174C-like isoform X1 [Stegostoma tigrinum]
MKLGVGSSSVSLVLAVALCVSVAVQDPVLSPAPRTDAANNNNSSSSTGPPPPHQAAYPDKSVIRRAVWVLLGISGLGLVYFIIRSIRLKKTQRKKYGLLASYDDHVEMAPVDTDDDDTTLFEVKGMRRSINHTASQSC